MLIWPSWRCLPQAFSIPEVLHWRDYTNLFRVQPFGCEAAYCNRGKYCMQAKLRPDEKTINVRMRFSNFFPSFLFRSLLFPSFSNAAAFSPSHFSAYSHIYFSLIRMSRYFPTFAAILLHKVFEDSIPNDSSSVFIICVQGYDACLALVPHSTFVFVDASQMWAIIRNTHDMHLQWKDYSVVQSCFEVHRTACEPSLARKNGACYL